MKRVGFASMIVLAAAGCGGGGRNNADAGACEAPLSLAWPSEADPQVCSRQLTMETVRTQCGDITEDCDTTGVTRPNLDCLTGDPPVLPPDPATVTLEGFADVFSNGPSSTGVRVQVFRASDIGPSVTDLSQVGPIGQTDLVLDATTVQTARACPKDRMDPADLHGDCVIPDTNCSGCDIATDAPDFCYMTSCYPRQRWEIRYSIPNIPTNTFLVIRSIGLNGGTPDPENVTWAPLVQYNVFLSTADRACVADAYRDDENCLDTAGATPIYKLNVNLLSRSDYDTIPITAGLSAGVAPGHGAIAGEVHDCDDIRLTWAQIGYNPVPLKTIYFNDNPYDTLPSLGRTEGTDTLGLFSGLDIAPGDITVVGIGLVDGVPTEMGRFTARIFADTVTTVGINGGKPQQ